MRSWFVVVLFACGGKTEPVGPQKPVIADAAPVPEMPVIDASVAVAAPKKPVVVAVDPQSLPLWDTPKGIGKGPPITVFAVDMVGSQLLAVVSDDPIVMPTLSKRVTGRIAGPRDLVAAAIATQLGVDPAPLKIGGKGATVDLDFTSAPTADLLRVIADTGRVNIIAPGPLPNLELRVHRKPWDGTLEAIAKATGRTLTRSGNTFYLLPSGTALPPLSAIKMPVTVDLDIKDGTTAHAVAALALLAPVPIAACDGKPFTQRLKRVPLAEALRAMALLGGATLAPNVTCKATPVAATHAVSDLKLVAIAAIGIKRAAAFDYKGAVITGMRDGAIIDDIGDSYVSFGGKSVTMREPYTFSGDDHSDYLKSMRRVAALIKTGDKWAALIETPTMFRYVSEPMPPLLTKVTITPTGAELEAGDVHAELVFGRFQ